MFLNTFGPMDAYSIFSRLRPFELYTVSCAWLLPCWYIPTTFGRPNEIREKAAGGVFGEAAKPGFDGNQISPEKKTTGPDMYERLFFST